MKKILLLIVMCISGSCSWNTQPVSVKRDLKPIAVTQYNYVPGTEDIPVYEGFYLAEDEQIAYDSPYGRVVKATFFNRGIFVGEVRAFYDKTLPQLGWKKLQYQIYEREGEKLKIDINNDGSRVMLTFTLTPSSK